MDINESLENFRNSPLIKKLFPEEIIQKSISHFAYRNIINFLQNPTIGDLALCIKNPGLHEYMIRAAGSDAYAQRILSRLKLKYPKKNYSDPEVYRHLAARGRDRPV